MKSLLHCVQGPTLVGFAGQEHLVDDLVELAEKIVAAEFGGVVRIVGQVEVLSGFRVGRRHTVSYAYMHSGNDASHYFQYGLSAVLVSV